MIGYSIPFGNRTFGHYKHRLAMVNDVDDASTRRLYVDMQVRSGDYFATLATRLDELSQEALQVNDQLGEDLENIVSELLHLQHNYRIEKK